MTMARARIAPWADHGFVVDVLAAVVRGHYNDVVARRRELAVGLVRDLCPSQANSRLENDVT
jgi:hypothetical protein